MKSVFMTPNFRFNLQHPFIFSNFQQHALVAHKLLSQCPGIKPIQPKGAMYMMTMIDLEKFPAFATCREWTEKLIEEQSVLLFPGYPCFNYPSCFRIVLTVPEDKIREGCERINEFCRKYYSSS